MKKTKAQTVVKTKQQQQSELISKFIKLKIQEAQLDAEQKLLIDMLLAQRKQGFKVQKAEKIEAKINKYLPEALQKQDRTLLQPEYVRYIHEEQTSDDLTDTILCLHSKEYELIPVLEMEKRELEVEEQEQRSESYPNYFLKLSEASQQNKSIAEKLKKQEANWKQNQILNPIYLSQYCQGFLEILQKISN